jgi:multidrug resistance protein MdtO
MSASAALPPIDEGDPPRLAGLLRQVLSPAPGQFGNTVRVVVLVLAVVSISETFRLPGAAISAYIVLFVSRAEAASTAMSALVAGLAVITAIFAAIVVFMMSLSEPALRIPLIAVLTFVGMFLSRASALGPVFIAAGFIMAYGLTFGDEVLGVSLQPGSTANTPQFTLPELVFVPPEEALLQSLLWLALAVAIPVAVVIAANLLTGRDPAIILRAALVERLEAAARFCARAPGAERQLIALAREGSGELHKLEHLSGLLHRRAGPPAPIAETGQLLLLLLTWRRVANMADLTPAAAFCHAAARALDGGGVVPSTLPQITTTGLARPLREQLTDTLLAIRDALAPTTLPPAGQVRTPARAAKHFLAADAFTNPAYARFALKVTLAVMLCYITQSLLNWPGIHTCIITCFFIALGTVGETVHKATLRFVGCLIGAALGIGAILLVMPSITDLGGLCLLLLPVTFIAGWIGFGSERVAYAGWQIAMAFYLSVLQQFGPTLDMETARDRVVGILFGNVVVFVIFVTIWPMSASEVARANLANAVGRLAALLRADPADKGAAAAHAQQNEFVDAIAKARAVIVNDPFETSSVRRVGGRHPIDAATLLKVLALIIPVSAILDLERDLAGREIPPALRNAARPHRQALADWFQRAASWIRTGAGASEIVASLPLPPPLTLGPEPAGPAGDDLAARRVWYRLLDDDIRTILDEVGSSAEPSELRFATA